MAEALAGAGADIVGVDYRGFSADDGSEAQARIEATGRPFTGMLADLSQRSGVESLIASIARDVPRVDILVNNAGTIARAPAAEHPTEDWDRVLAVNLTAPFLLTREVGRAMVERGAGKIIFTASLLSFQGGILVPSYAASKSGVAGLVRRSRTNGPPAVSTSTRSLRDTSRPTTRRRCARTPTAAARSSTAFPQGAGVRRPTWVA